MRLLPLIVSSFSAAVIWIAPSEASVSDSVFRGSDSATSTWFRASSASLPLHAATVPVFPTPNARSTIPSSVLPHTANRCSALTEPAPGAECSVFPGQLPARCSVAPGFDQQCSAFGEIGSPGKATCSAQGQDRAICSILPPESGFALAASCSVIGGDQFEVDCSVIRDALERQGCSTLNNSGFVSAGGCSVSANFSPPLSSRCSVLAGTSFPRNACSTALAPDPGSFSRTCSAVSSGGCSVLPGVTGICSAFQGAPAGSCSVEAFAGRCSIIGGASGLLCIQP